MVPLDPPFAADATVGGVIAANSSGPRRRLYGTARDLVIGMRFATLEGKLVQSGGMVVKNVAGLDMAKLMIGSFGTLAAIAVVNFKLQPMPEMERSFLLPFASAAEAVAARDRILAGPLQPAAVDLLNPAAGATARASAPGCWPCAPAATAPPWTATSANWRPQSGGVASKTSSSSASGSTSASSRRNSSARHPDGAVVRASCTLKEVGAVMESFAGPGRGARRFRRLLRVFRAEPDAAAEWMAGCARRGLEGRDRIFARGVRSATLDLWPAPGARSGNHAAGQEAVRSGETY